MASDPSIGRPPTIRTVAARAGVSKSLVSLVLQNSPRVSDEKRQAVIRAVAELGYRPDPVARSLAERRTRTIGVILDDLSSPWWTKFSTGSVWCCMSTAYARCLRMVGQSLMPWRLCPTCGWTASCWSARRPSRPSPNGVPWEVRCRRSSQVRVTRLFQRWTLSHTTTTAAVDSRRRTCWNSVIKKSRTSSEWARGAGSGGRATKHQLADVGLRPVSVQGDWTEATGATARPGTFGVIGPPDRDPCGERPLRGRSPGRGG